MSLSLYLFKFLQIIKGGDCGELSSAVLFCYLLVRTGDRNTD